ncbi:hypothetical protein C9F11_24010 [Streptomyces sp. YIM 121038]|uniref:hypothetical protein n=1 Tax=Streptomyces sp. YIM 121038 TaxID=2136401 RepID=UPI0011650B2F|nr:hypothetical protein [Streptomyces sp. YIM 121038]QCX78418.1 hypothetical protein C9F11_24010 [Streptomyces sp. YIM 121038]
MTGADPRTERVGADVPPEDYRLLVPRDWFRIDLTLDRWRPQLKTFADRQAARRGMSAEAARGLWATLRNTAESGAAQGAIELFLRSEISDTGATPATLLVSLLPMSGALYVTPQELARSVTEHRGAATKVSVTRLPAGETVRVTTATTLDLYVNMPGKAGYLLLAFSVPLSGVESSLGGLCEAIAASLRWV